MHSGNSNRALRVGTVGTNILRSHRTSGGWFDRHEVHCQNVCSSRLTRVCRIAAVAAFSWLSLAIGGRSAQAQITVPTNYQNYAIIGQSTVEIGSFSRINGDVYGAGNVTLDSDYGDFLTSGNFYTRGGFVENNFGEVNGNVAANGNLTLVGSTNLNGNAVYGGTATYQTRSNISGSLTQSPNAVPAVSLPAAIPFTYGTQSISTTNNLVLQPGSYGDITMTGTYTTLTLSSGDYYLKSLNASGSSSLRSIYLNITNGPIRIFSDGDISIGNYIDVYLNGASPFSTPSPSAGALASAVLWQSNHNINITQGTISSFAGTLFAPNGSVTANVGEYWYGSVLAGGAINASAYLTKEPYNFGNLALAYFPTPNTASVIVGGSAKVAGNLTNLTMNGGGTLNYSVTGQVVKGGLTLGSIQSGSVAPGGSTSLSVPITATQVGQAQIAININDPNALTTSTAGTLNVNVLDHAAFAYTATTARAMHGSTASGTASIQDVSAMYRAGLQIVDPGGLLDIAAGAVIPNGGSASVRGALDTSSFGPTTSMFTLKLSDDQSVPGAINLPNQQVTVSGNILDNRRVTAAGTVDLGLVHNSATASGAATLTTTGADNQFTRITVNNTAAADANGISISGSTTFRFGLDGMSGTKTVSGIPNKLGVVTGSISLTTNGEASIPGTQVLANVVVPYTVKVFSGQASWNGSTADVWNNQQSWTDNLSNAGAGSPGISGFNTDSATFGNVIAGSAANIALNGSNPSLGGLTFDNNLGGSYTISVGTGGAITVATTAGGTPITVNNGNHRISTPITLSGGNSIAVNNSQSTLTIDGAVTSTSGLTKTGPGTLVLTAVSNNLGPVTISGGTLRGSLADLNNSIVNNGALIFDQPTDVTFAGTVSGTGSITKTGSGRMTIPGTGNFNANAPLTVAGGSLVLPVGLPQVGAAIQLVTGGTIEAANSIPRAVSGTGTILATDDLTIGRSSQAGQFNLGGAAGVGGTLNVGNHAVVVLSKDAAILGSLTTIADQGSLTTLNGAQLGLAHSLDSTKILSVTGNAVVNGNFINNGSVNGPAQSGQWLTFTQDVRGAGSTTGNILYAGSYSPGNSPAVVSAENIAFDSTSKLFMEVSGPGFGQFDQLLVSGTATLAGTLDLSMLNGYSLESGKTYPLITGTYAGRFDQIAGLPSGWDVAYENGLVALVPEPSTLMLLGGGFALLCLPLARRKRIKVLAMQRT